MTNDISAMLTSSYSLQAVGSFSFVSDDIIVVALVVDSTYNVSRVTRVSKAVDIFCVFISIPASLSCLTKTGSNFVKQNIGVEMTVDIMLIGINKNRMRCGVSWRSDEWRICR